jgi:hypothetical protein
MGGIYRWAATIAVVIMSQSAIAGLSGNDLFSNCEGIDDRSAPAHKGIACMMFIAGVSDGWHGAIAVHAKSQLRRGSVNFCMPDEVTGGQAASVVAKYLRDNPAERHKLAAIIVVTALSKAFPCPM